MPLTTITLNPYAQGNGSGFGDTWDIIDPPTPFGSGSLSDGSDTSGMTIGAERDISSQSHGEPVALWFKTPPGFDPFALLLQTRMQNNTEVVGATIPTSTRRVNTRFLSADGTVVFDLETVSGGLISPLLTPETTAVTTPTDFTWWAGNNVIDLGDPSEAGGWYQLDWSFSSSSGDKAALIGDGLRLEVGFEYLPSAGSPHLNWLDVFEVSLLVAGVVAGGSPPLRRYPRSDGLGVGPRRHYPPTSYRQTSTRRGVGNS
jgi:hypothetical protein